MNPYRLFRQAPRRGSCLGFPLQAFAVRPLPHLFQPVLGVRAINAEDGVQCHRPIFAHHGFSPMSTSLGA